MSLDPDLYESMRLELRRGSLVLAVLACLRTERYGYTLRQALAALGYETPEEPPALERHAIACPALPTCGLAITESERILPAVLGASYVAQLEKHTG